MINFTLVCYFMLYLILELKFIVGRVPPPPPLQFFLFTAQPHQYISYKVHSRSTIELRLASSCLIVPSRPLHHRTKRLLEETADSPEETDITKTVFSIWYLKLVDF